MDLDSFKSRMVQIHSNRKTYLSKRNLAVRQSTGTEKNPSVCGEWMSTVITWTTESESENFNNFGERDQLLPCDKNREHMLESETYIWNYGSSYCQIWPGSHHWSPAWLQSSLQLRQNWPGQEWSRNKRRYEQIFCPRMQKGLDVNTNTNQQRIEREGTYGFPLVWLFHITPGIRQEGQHCCDPTGSGKFASLFKK